MARGPGLCLSRLTWICGSQLWAASARPGLPILWSRKAPEGRRRGLMGGGGLGRCVETRVERQGACVQ